MKKRNKIKEIKDKIEIFILCFFALVILLIGCHYGATYTIKGTVYNINENEITFEDKTGNLFSCYTEESNPDIYKGEKFILKLNHKGTELDRTDDGLIDFGKHSFLCFVW